MSVHTIESFSFAQIEVFNILGQRLFQRSFEEPNTTFELSHLPLGPCIIRLDIDGKMRTFKVCLY